MTQIDNMQVVLSRRPAGVPEAADLQLRTDVAPEPGDGQFQIRHLYLALSPSARIRMSGDSDYGPGMALGRVVQGQTVGVVTRSRHPGFIEGDIVLTNGGWQQYSLSSGASAIHVDTARMSPLDALGVLGTSGLTAYVGLFRFGRPVAGQTLLVSAASGSVGSVVGQLGKIAGCRVVGVTGGPAKCRHLLEDLAFDAAVDHRADDFPQALARACPNGVDIYFENVGGAVLTAAWPLMADFGRVVLCGMVAEYSSGQSAGGPNWLPILTKRLCVSGFLLRDHFTMMEEFRDRASEWIAQGKLKMTYDLTRGLSEAPAAFGRLLQGDKLGKSIVEIGNV